MDKLNTDHIDDPAAIDEAPEVEAPAPIIEPEVVVEPTPAPQSEPTPKPIVVEKPKATQAVSGNDVDEVLLANCIYKNVFARKSLSVHHLQRRLIELGFKDADADKDGWLGDETASAIKKFQASKGLDVTGSVDATTLTKIFEGDRNVQVVL
jgi:hypothetical protein